MDLVTTEPTTDHMDDAAHLESDGADRVTPLSEAEGLVEVLSVADEVGQHSDLLDFLDDCGLVPGLWAEIVRQTTAGTRVVGARAHAVLPPALADRVLVRPIDPLAD